MEIRIGVATTETIRAVASRVAVALETELHAHESSYIGDPYFRGKLTDGTEITVVENLDPMFREGDPEHERWHEPDARHCPVLVWLDNDDEHHTMDAEGIRGVLADSLGCNVEIVSSR